MTLVKCARVTALYGTLDGLLLASDDAFHKAVIGNAARAFGDRPLWSNCRPTTCGVEGLLR